MKAFPFLSVVESSSAIRPLAGTLAKVEVPEAVSPWTPRGAATPAPVATIDVEAEQAAGREAGRAEGLAETERLRAQLAKLTGELAAARARVAEIAAEQIADAATAVVEAWLGSVDRAAVFAPIVQAWTAKCRQPATARVAPVDLEAARQAIGDAAITLEADPAMRPGDLALRAAELELTFDWQARLRELRDAIAGGT
jgi:flagellar biosynthesis/type III secretory pathway protein FliH